MAFAAPNAGKSQPAIQGGESGASTLIANAATNGAAAGALAPATPGGVQSSQSPATQSQQSAAAGNQSPNAATESNKAATLAQAAEGSVRQGHSAPVTEAQSLPLQFVLTDTKTGSKQDSAHTTSGEDGETDQADPPPASAAASQSTPSAASSHSATLPSPPASLPAASEAPAALAPAIAGTQASSALGQQVPQAATTLPPAQAATPLAAPDLNQLALNIASKSLDGAKQFDIRLDPVELGRVDVRLSVDSTGMAQAHLAAERPETLALLQSNSGALTRALQDSGVQVASNGLQFSLKGQERQTDGQQRAPSRNRSSAVPGIAAAGAMNNGSSSYSLSPMGEGVNILV
jgi:flagellar hook-length control protein FliK